MRTLIALVIALSIFFTDEITGPQPTLPRSPLSIETERGPVRFTVEVARSQIQQQRGLMFRRSLAPDAGMARRRCILALKSPSMSPFCWSTQPY